MSKQQKLKIEELNRLDVDQFRQAEKIPLTIVLDNVRSRNNIGSVFRTADAFRVERILLCGITSTPPNPEIHKTALGAEDSVSWQYFDETIDAVNMLKSEGYIIYSIEQAHGSHLLQTVQPDRGQRHAIILGHEVHGVQQAIVDASHYCVEIPQYGTKHSLNVSVAAGIVIWDFFQKLF